MPERVLFLGTGNSCRSQMAEGLLRSLGGAYQAFSAGTEPHGLNPMAVEAMREIGIDISGQQSESVEAYRGNAFDHVITECDHARQTCPVLPGGRQHHWSFDDPGRGHRFARRTHGGLPPGARRNRGAAAEVRRQLRRLTAPGVSLP